MPRIARLGRSRLLAQNRRRNAPPWRVSDRPTRHRPDPNARDKPLVGWFRLSTKPFHDLSEGPQTKSRNQRLLPRRLSPFRPEMEATPKYRRAGRLVLGSADPPASEAQLRWTRRLVAQFPILAMSFGDANQHESDDACISVADIFCRLRLHQCDRYDAP